MHQFGGDLLKVTCLDALFRDLGVAVTRIAHPDHGNAGLFHGTNMLGQELGYLLAAVTSNQCQLSCNTIGALDYHKRKLAARTGFSIGIEHFNEFNELVDGDRGSHFETDRVCNAAEVFNVRAIDLTGTISDPQEMSAKIREAG